MGRRKKQEDVNEGLNVTLEILNLLKEQLNLMRDELNNNKKVSSDINDINIRIDKMIDLINNYTHNINNNLISSDKMKLLLSNLKDDVNKNTEEKMLNMIKQNEGAFLNGLEEKLDKFKNEIFDRFVEIEKNIDNRLVLFGNEKPKNVWQFFYFLFSRRFKEVIIVVLFILLAYLVGFDLIKFFKIILNK